MGAEFAPPGGVQLQPAWRCGVELGRYLRFPPPMDLGSYARLPWGENAVCHKAIFGIVRSGAMATPSQSVAVWFPLRHFGLKVSTSRSSLLRSSLHCCGVRSIAAEFAPYGSAQVRAASWWHGVGSVRASSCPVGSSPIYAAALGETCSLIKFNRQ